MIKTYKDLDVYNLSFDLAMEIFKLTKSFPPEERYNLTDQIRRAARSVPLNIAEGWAKRQLEKVFKKHLMDCIGSCEEVKVCLDFSLACEYIDDKSHKDLASNCGRIGAKLSRLMDKWETY